MEREKKEMMLQTILFGTFVPPENTTVRTHRLGLGGGQSYVPPKARGSSTVDATGMNRSERAVFAAIKKFDKYVPAAEVAKKAKLSRNHCQIILAGLFKLGKVTRYKVSANGTRYYMYQAKDKA